MENLFKYLHIVAAMIWIGGACALVIINTRLSRSQNWAVVEALAQQGAFYGRAVLGPAAATTLLAGIATTFAMGIRFRALWIMWGFAGIAVSMLIGAVFIRRTQEDLGKLAAAGTDQAGIAALQRRLATLNLINLVILLSVVAAMVFKPV